MKVSLATDTVVKYYLRPLIHVNICQVALYGIQSMQSMGFLMSSCIDNVICDNVNVY